MNNEININHPSARRSTAQLMTHTPGLSRAHRSEKPITEAVADSAKAERGRASNAPYDGSSHQICALAGKSAKGLALGRATAYVRGQLTNFKQPSGATR